VFLVRFDNNVEKVQPSNGLISILEIPSKKENEKADLAALSGFE